MRLGACLGVPLHLIGPLGFVLSNRHLRRVGMDYMTHASWEVHPSWSAFQPMVQVLRRRGGRLIALTTQASQTYLSYRFHPEDMLLAGSESQGLPQEYCSQTDQDLRIPMRAGCRSLNLVTACTLVLGEGLRQTQQFPETT